MTMLFVAALLSIAGTGLIIIGGLGLAATIGSTQLLYGALLAGPGYFIVIGLVLLGLSAIVTGIAHIRADIRRAVGAPPKPEMRPATDWPIPGASEPALYEYEKAARKRENRSP